MPFSVLVNPDEATPVVSVKTPSLIGAELVDGCDEPLELGSLLDELHAVSTLANRVAAVTAMTILRFMLPLLVTFAVGAGRALARPVAADRCTATRQGILETSLAYARCLLQVIPGDVQPLGLLPLVAAGTGAVRALGSRNEQHRRRGTPVAALL